MLNFLKFVGHIYRRREYVLGAPIDDRIKFYKTDLVKRFGGAVVNGEIVLPPSTDTNNAYERAYSYLDAAIDRQINKASGLLTFNSILLAVLYSYDLYKSHSYWRLSLTTMLVLACMLLLDMMLMIWSGPEVFGSAIEDLDGALHVCRNRTRVLSLSIVISIAATLLMLVLDICYVTGICEWLWPTVRQLL